MMNRRHFIGKSALGIGSALLASQLPTSLTSATTSKALKKPLGFQVWTVKDQLIKDFAGTLKMMAGQGYQSVEMCSPPGYESSGFGPLMSMKAAEMKKIVEDWGLTLESTHYGMGELRNNLSERIDFALESGQKQMICSSFWLPKDAKMSDWMKAVDELNEIGAKTKKAGIQTGFHNHHMEFEKIDGVLIYDELLKHFDPELVKMQFQVAVISIGYKAETYFKKYPGRFISAHLADWSSVTEKQVPIGQGAVDWKELFAAAEKSGVKNYFVEMAPETFKESANYIHKL
ncbi:MAG: sugar phosphate isomerase/epimerase [Prolixibacteraceae bacterium]|nr:sugar phosphate isomerase/epimerase [Prolixibacteraceae bacterium]